MRRRHDIRLVLLALAILAGLVIERIDRNHLAGCGTCERETSLLAG